MKYKNSQSRPIKSSEFFFFALFFFCTVLTLNNFNPSIFGQFIKSSILVANLAKESLVSTNCMFYSTLETRSENKEPLSDLFKKLKQSKEVPLFVYPRDKFCAFCFTRRHMEKMNKRQKVLSFSMVFTEYYYHFSFSRY